jgi:hypothetical protein
MATMKMILVPRGREGDATWFALERECPNGALVGYKWKPGKAGTGTWSARTTVAALPEFFDRLPRCAKPQLPTF